MRAATTSFEPFRVPHLVHEEPVSAGAQKRAQPTLAAVVRVEEFLFQKVGEELLGKVGGILTVDVPLHAHVLVDRSPVRGGNRFDGQRARAEIIALRRWWDRRGELRGGGQRVSRHYYDVHCLLVSVDWESLVKDTAMAADCVRHARMFFNRPDLDLATAAPGSYALAPHDEMLANLEQDYNAMSQMIFGEIPAFAAIIESVVKLEERLNEKE